MSQRRTYLVARSIKSKSKVLMMGEFFKPGMPVAPRLKKWRAGDIGQRKYGRTK